MNDLVLKVVTNWLRDDRADHVLRALNEFNSVSTALAEYFDQQREVITRKRNREPQLQKLSQVIRSRTLTPTEKQRFKNIRKFMLDRMKQEDAFNDQLTQTIVAIRRAFLERNQNSVQ